MHGCARRRGSAARQRLREGIRRDEGHRAEVGERLHETIEVDLGLVERAVNRSTFRAVSISAEIVGQQQIVASGSTSSVLFRSRLSFGIVWTWKPALGCVRHRGIDHEFIAGWIAPHSQKHSFYDGSIIDRFRHRNYLTNSRNGRRETRNLSEAMSCPIARSLEKWAGRGLVDSDHHHIHRTKGKPCPRCLIPSKSAL
jgi:hypothetical protein